MIAKIEMIAKIVKIANPPPPNEISMLRRTGIGRIAKIAIGEI